MFGGINSKEVLSNDMWLIRANSAGSSNKLFALTAEKLSISGMPPKPRCGHSAILYAHYIAIFGGKNFGEVSFALDDLFLFNIEKCSWDEVVVYGFNPYGRYGHAHCLYKNKMLIFGGANASRYCGNTISVLEMGTYLIR